MKKYIPVILKGIFLGWIIYSLLVLFTQQNLKKQIGKAQTFQNMFDGDPALQGILEVESIKHKFNEIKCTDDQNSKLPWRIARNMGVIGGDVSEQNMDNRMKNSLSLILCKEDVSKLEQKRGVELLIEFLKNSGMDHSGANQADLEKAIVKILANSPFGYRDFKRTLEDNQSSKFENSWFRRFFSYSAPPEIFKSVWSNHSEKDLLSLLYIYFNVGQEEYRNINPSLISEIESYEQFNDMALKLTLFITNHPKVTAAKEGVMMFKGLIQLLIFMVFGIALFHIFTVGENVNKHKAFLNVLKTTLPTLGFIGTIIGLMKSLGQAYKIPLSNGGADTSIAIKEITTALGLAFTTTLLAFILLIIIDAISIKKLQAYWK